jgi:hypothetical protein
MLSPVSKIGLAVECRFVCNVRNLSSGGGHIMATVSCAVDSTLIVTSSVCLGSLHTSLINLGRIVYWSFGLGMKPEPLHWLEDQRVSISLSVKWFSFVELTASVPLRS